MPQTWFLHDAPKQKLSFDQLAIMLSRGTVSESTQVVHCESQTLQQIFDIPGLERAARKLQQAESPSRLAPVAVEPGGRRLNLSKRTAERHDQQQTTSRLRSFSQLIFKTKPNVAFVAISFILLASSFGIWKYSSYELLRFPRPMNGQAVRVLPLIGDIPKFDFWIVQCCFGLAAITAFEMSILRGTRIRGR